MGADNLHKNEIKDIPYVDPETKVRYGMKLHDFLCIFLYISAAFSLFMGVMYFIGKGEYQWLYDFGIESGVFPYSKIVTYVVGIISFISAPLALAARHKLAKLQKNGPLIFYIYLIFSCAGNILYIWVAVVIYKRLDLRFEDIFSVKLNIAEIAVIVALVLGCMFYYHNRKVYFVNGRPEDN